MAVVVVVVGVCETRFLLLLLGLFVFRAFTLCRSTFTSSPSTIKKKK